MRYFVYCRKSTDEEDRQVLSLITQNEGLERLRTQRWPDVAIVEVLVESRTAKKPGRPVFNQMLNRIEKGEADGVISWTPDRLARNSVDSGRIIYLLDLGVIKDLKFSDFSFENTAFGKFMLGMMFINSKLYVDKLSKDVSSGLDTKARQGWRPTQPPLGYLTDPITRTIISDPERFSLVKRMWTLMLAGNHTPRSIWEVATKSWGLRGKQHKKSAGNMISLSTVYQILGNIFYAGVFPWKGELIAGKHPALVSLDEFDRVQELLGRPGRPRPKTRSFAYTGLMRCTCGLAITAEEKVNRFGSHYTYYHCTRRKRFGYCREPYLNATNLEEQMAKAVGEIELHPDAKVWMVQRLGRLAASRVRERELQKLSRDESIASTEKQLTGLTRLHLRGLITEEEFLQQRTALQRDHASMVQRKVKADGHGNWIEPCHELVDFSIRAADYFRSAPPTIRRLILTTVGSHPTLGAGILNVEARKPFRKWSPVPTHSEMCTFLQDVRTFSCERRQELDQILENIRCIKTSVAQADTMKHATRSRSRLG